MDSMHAFVVVVNYDTPELTPTSFGVWSSPVEIDDAQIGRNLARLRGDMSQKELAGAMRDRGHKWSQATVWNVERGERPLRLTEATALGEILELLSVYSITAPEGQFAFRALATKVATSQNDLVEAARTVLKLQRELALEADYMQARKATAFSDEDDKRSLLYEIGFTPVEIVRDVQDEAYRDLIATGTNHGEFTQHMIDGLGEIKFTVDE